MIIVLLSVSGTSLVSFSLVVCLSACLCMLPCILWVRGLLVEMLFVMNLSMWFLDELANLRTQGNVRSV